MELLLLYALCIAVGQIVKGITGFGSALVSIPLLSLMVEPSKAIVFVLVSDVASGGWLAWNARKRVKWSIVGVMLSGVFVGQWIGTGVHEVLPEKAVRICLAVIVFAFAIKLLYRTDKGVESIPRRPDKRCLYEGGFFGMGAGLMAGLVGAGGPPVVYYTRRWFSDTLSRALLLNVFFPSSFVLCSLFIYRGIVDFSVVYTGLQLIPMSFLGALGGAWLSTRISPVVFSRLVSILLIGAAVGVALG